MSILYIGSLVALVVVAIYIVKNCPETESHSEQATTRETAASEASELPSNHVQLGIRAFMRGDYAQAFELLEPAARQDNLKAQQLLAKMYYAGNGVSEDQEQYLYWLKRAAANGDKPSRIKIKKIESGKT